MTRQELPALRAQLTIEFRRLTQVSEEITGLIRSVSEREPSRIEVVAAAAFLHNLYNAIENCLLRIAHAVDESVPTGPETHRLLVDQLTAPIPTLREALLDEELARRIDEYRRFRHAFRHMYFFDLDWPRMTGLLQNAEAITAKFTTAVITLLEQLIPPNE